MTIQDSLPAVDQPDHQRWETMRCPGAPSVEEVYQAELGEVPEVIRERSRAFGNSPIPRDSYTSKAVAELELESVWKHTWQFACLEADIPEVGDTHVYELGTWSVIVVRASLDQIKAYWNSCLHRGTQLRACDGNVARLRCPFHGWTWNLDGHLEELPSAWDLAHLDRTKLNLPELQVGLWEGVVFVNPDRDAAPLSEYLGDMPEHFKRWPLRNRVKVAHAVKVFRANWKIVMSAFIEGYHLAATHPEGIPVSSGENTQYSVYGNFSRVFTLQGMAQPAWAEDTTEQDIVDATFEVSGMSDDIPQVPDGMTARQFLSGMLAEGTRQKIGAELQCSDGETLDLPIYYLFPNSAFWGGYIFPLIYRWRPYGDDPEMSLMDIIVLDPAPEGAERPAPVKPHWIGPDESFVGTPNLPLPEVFDQDAANLIRVQRGLRSSPVTDHIELCNYQESLIRWHHELISEYIDRYTQR